MSMVTVSRVRNRVYQRKFDHDEARRLHAEEGLGWAEIGRRLGVHPASVMRVCDPRTRERMRLAGLRHAYVPCTVCGEPCSRYRQQGDYPRCQRCAGADRQTRFRLDELGQVAAVRCQACRRWLDPGLFQRNRTDSRGIHEQCRECGTRARRAYRQAGRVPCEGCGTLVEGKGRSNARADRRTGGRIVLDPGRPYLCRSCAVKRARARIGAEDESARRGTGQSG